jgi:hypothetical protein
VVNNVTNTLTSRSLEKWRGKALKSLKQLWTEMGADFFRDDSDKICLTQFVQNAIQEIVFK